MVDVGDETACFWGGMGSSRLRVEWSSYGPLKSKGIRLRLRVEMCYAPSGHNAFLDPFIFKVPDVVFDYEAEKTGYGSKWGIVATL